ncbi:TolB protein-related isoform 1 [Cucumis melo var. makuwa]|uniref:TolB protein-related isoform 1 n=1 Tax=Cucumis melo var. makuwa TaxID=1194695 RepID=A0A5A7URS2_CUCMM|nr:TolB protein-related isoform 1 [Cucumis melo var. makuwa]TYK10360.1 TolB protein-related isoform 1 [Cucumis melo var. makuwa]
MDNPTGAVLFTTIGLNQYGFDIFSVALNSPTVERRLTDGISVNFNAQFLNNQLSVVFISERSGSSRIYLSDSPNSSPKLLASAPGSCFHDRPIVRNGRLLFISAHENPHKPFTSWAALYSTPLDGDDSITRLTPLGSVDFSPAVSESGKFVAVASYGSRSWGGEFHELNLEIVVFKSSDPDRRVVVASRGGWPSWSGDSTVFFHRKAEDGWWSIFKVEIPENLDSSMSSDSPVPIRVTPAGLHCFTPAAMNDSRLVVVATRRADSKFRHIEIFDSELEEFIPITQKLNPDFHHYNPFVSPDSNFIGYHRFRGESTQSELIPYLSPVISPIKELQMIRINGSFPTPSPDGDLIAFNPNFNGLQIVKFDGSKCRTVLKDRTAFYNSWSPTEKNVIYTSLGPIFGAVTATVQIARITINSDDLKDGDSDEVSSEVKILTKDDTGNNAFPACSPDGKFLVFRSGRSGHKNLYIVDAVKGEFEGELRRLTDGAWIDTMPNWSPRGDLIVFSSNMHNPKNTEAFSIYVIRPDGSGLRRVYVAGPEGSSEVDRERINHVCFSRDGKWLLFTANLSGVTAEPVSWPNQFQPYGDLFVVRLDGTGLRRLTWNGYENGTPTWYYGSEVALSGLSLKDEVVGEKLKGNFDEPLWITFD